MPHSSLNNLDVRSEEVQEVLSFIPHWIVRWGITVLLFVVIAIFVMSWVVKYPDIIPSKITLVTQNPPIHILTRSAGKLTQFSLQDKNFVRADSILAVIENPAITTDVLHIVTRLKDFQKIFLGGYEEQTLQYSFPPNPQLGEIQADYAVFMQNFTTYKTFLQVDARYYESRISALSAQLRSYHELGEKLRQQQQYTARDEEMARKKYDIDKGLFQKKYMSEVEMNTSESVYLAKKSALENAHSSIVNNTIQINLLDRSILDLKQQQEEKARVTVMTLRESLNRLLSNISGWEQRYLIKAPVDGVVSLSKYWAKNQYVTVGDEVLTLIPGEQTVIGKITLPIAGSGKVKVGQKAHIKLDGFPYQEFGAIEAVINDISLVPNNNHYVLTVMLPRGLQTTYHKTLDFKQEMQGTADIVTEDLRLIERFFFQFRYIFTRSM